MQIPFSEKNDFRSRLINMIRFRYMDHGPYKNKVQAIENHTEVRVIFDI